MVFNIDEWREVTEKCNGAVSELKSELSFQRASLIDELNRICFDNELLVWSIRASDDNSVFEIHFDNTVMNTSNSIHFSKKFLKSLNMSFSVQRKLDKDARNEMYLEVYPLEK